jgi:hypothetical protein
MGKRTNRQQPPNELVSHYREIGIPAVAAAARYQTRDRASPRRQGDVQENVQESSPSRENANENVEARRRFVVDT